MDLYIYKILQTAMVFLFILAVRLSGLWVTDWKLWVMLAGMMIAFVLTNQ